MKKYFFILIISYVLIGCTQENTKNQKIPIKLIPTENLSMVLDSFIKENNCNENCYFEIHIDKQFPDQYIIFIYSGNRPLTEQEDLQPIMYTMVSGIKFDIYSGVEKYFRVDDDVLIDNEIPAFSDIGRKIWLVRDSANIMTVTDFYFAYPFMPLPSNSVRFFDPMQNK